jgi:hypothetical protein
MVSRAWLDGLLRECNGIAHGQGGLTQGQLMWREIHRQAVASTGETPADTAQPVRKPPRRRTPARRTRVRRFDLIDSDEL